MIRRVEMDCLEIFKQEYGKKAKEYSLPSFDKLNEDLFIQDFINEKKFVPQGILGFVRSRMVELFAGWTGYLHGFIMPSPQSAILMTEYRKLTEEDKKQIIDIIQDMMIMQKESNLLGLQKDEKKDAEFIKKYFKLWTDSKKRLIDVSKKSLENWKKRDIEEVKERISF
jgi:hypothetical protein